MLSAESRLQLQESPKSTPSESHLHITHDTPPSHQDSVAPSSVAAQKPKSRSRLGCFTCRKRKKRCDEKKPVCNACTRLKLECVYPVPGQERKNRKRKRDQCSAEELDGLSEDGNDAKIVVPETKSKSHADGNNTNQQQALMESPSSPQPVWKFWERGNTPDEFRFLREMITPPPPISLTTGQSHNHTHNHNQSHNQSLAGAHTPKIEELDEQGRPIIVNNSEIQFNSPSNFFDTQDNFMFNTPLFSTPSPWYEQYLDKFGIDMFEYYNSHLAKMICVSPGYFNSFLDVFVPMAQQDPAVLYAMVAYASFHKNRGTCEDLGVSYLSKSIDLVQSTAVSTPLTALATRLLLATAEICRGDTARWDKHLREAAHLIQRKGGMGYFGTDRAKRWLATNFFYHEILSARTSAQTHFKPSEYEQVLESDPGVHTLIGCCKPIFNLMATLSSLAAKSKYEYMGQNNMADIYSAALNLEERISKCEPSAADIMMLPPSDQEDQLTLFETFQLTAKLHLRQSILHHNAASLPMQLLAQELLTSLDVILDTKVQGLLIFPLFMVSIMAITPVARAAMERRFEQFYVRNYARNIVRARELVRKVWELDCFGTKYVNWADLVGDEFDICFA